VNGFIDHSHTRLGTRSSYSATDNLHNSQITTTLAKPFSSLLYLHQPFPDNGFQQWRSLTSCAEVLSSQPPVQNYLSTKKSKSYWDWQSVSQSVLVSYPIWGIWPGICLLGLILRKLQSCLCGRPLWREVGSVDCRSVLCVMSLSQLYTIYKM
jgi:hypothetical protein